MCCVSVGAGRVVRRHGQTKGKKMACFPLLDGDEIGMDGMGCDGVDHEMNYPTA
jgi:hypothetical protein